MILGIINKKTSANKYSMKINEDFLDTVEARERNDAGTLVSDADMNREPYADDYECRMIIRWWWSGHAKMLVDTLTAYFEANPSISESSFALIYKMPDKSPANKDKSFQPYERNLNDYRQKMNLKSDSVVIAFNPDFISVRQFLNFIKAVYRIVIKYGGMRRRTEKIVFTNRKDGRWTEPDDYKTDDNIGHIDFKTMQELADGTYPNVTDIFEQQDLVTLVYMFVKRPDSYERLVNMFGKDFEKIEVHSNYSAIDRHLRYATDKYTDSELTRACTQFSEFMKTAEICIDPKVLEKNYLTYTAKQFITECGNPGTSLCTTFEEGIGEFNHTVIPVYKDSETNYKFTSNGNYTSVVFIMYLGHSKPIQLFSKPVQRQYSVSLLIECYMPGKIVKSKINRFISALDKVIVGGLPKAVKIELKTFLLSKISVNR